MVRLVCGVDEAGRGPLAGEVFAAAVILDDNRPIAGLNDSKKLAEKKREELFEIIMERALAFAIATSSVKEIDDMNILNATMLAMQRAIMNLSILPEIVLIDGNRTPDVPFRSQAIVGGDALIAEISAASILAKVARDREMRRLHELYPQYEFASHKGYGTKLHIEKLREYGPLPDIHRQSFAPVSNYYSLF